MAKLDTYPDMELKKYVLDYFKELGIDLDQIAAQAVEHQSRFIDGLTLGDGKKRLNRILNKREVLNALAVAVQLDKLANLGHLDEPLQNIIANDAGTFGVDETMAISLAQLFGSISVTNYGYLDVNKSKEAKKLDELQKSGKKITVFIDDMVSALQAAVESSLAHIEQKTDLIMCGKEDK